MVLIAIGGCQSLKKSTEEVVTYAPFKIIKATHHSWYGGQPGIEGRKIYITVDNPKIRLDSVYFRSMKTQLKRSDSLDRVFIGVFINSKTNYVLDIDPKKEFGNRPPINSLKSSFELKDNEAVVKYSTLNERGYYKIENLIETNPVNFP